jgi:hypothetical protein
VKNRPRLQRKSRNSAHHKIKNTRYVIERTKIDLICASLENAVERARVRRWGRGWQGATTQRALARKAEQRRQTRPQRCNRVRSVFTQKVNAIEAEKFSVHAGLQRNASGQLRFLGLM